MEKRTFQVAGVQFRPKNEIAEAVNKMKKGDYLGLVAEPENKFDPNAVKIEYNTETADGIESTFLGYVPKKYSAEIAGLLEIGLDLECRVEEVIPSGKPWEMIKVTIKEPSDEDESEDESEVEEQ